ncbi:MAG TPA: Dabb family protein [Ideonella sp.]|nr:Dabb family protein [Ideonella sp.]
MTIRHVVLLRFKPETGPDAINLVEQSFAALHGAIAEVQELEWGTNNSPEGLDHGFTHCFSLGFADTAARDAYLVHPTHQGFTALAGPHFADVLVVDYELHA